MTESKPNLVLAKRTVSPKEKPLRAADLTLFRQEAIDRRFEVTKPRPVYLSPLPWRVITLLLAATALVFALLVSLGSFPRKETVSGTIKPNFGEVLIEPSRSGRIAQVFVTEGQMVDRGDRLFTIETEQSLSDGRSLNALAVDMLETQHRIVEAERQARITDLQSQIAASELDTRRLETRLVSIRERKTLVTERRDDLTQHLRKMEELQENGFVPERTIRQQREAVASAKIELSRLDDERIDAEAEIASAVTFRSSLQSRISSEAASLRSAIVDLQGEMISTESERGALQRAPSGGTISGLEVASGKWVKQGGPVMTIIPAGVEFIAELYVPPTAVGFVEPGQTVKLMYDAFPFQKFGISTGTVISVSDAPIASVSLDEPVFAVKVKLDRNYVEAFGNQRPIKAGMTLRADLILEERTVFEWLLEPVFAITEKS